LDVQGLSVNGGLYSEAELAELPKLRLSKLKRLGLYHQKFPDRALECLSAFRGIEELSVDFHLTPQGWELLKHMTSLKRLCVTGGPFSREDIQALAQMKTIEHLRIDESQMADGTLACLNNMDTLKDLDLMFLDPRHTRNASMLTTMTQPERLRMGFKIEATDIACKDLLLECLRGIGNLYELKLGPSFTDAGLSLVARMHSLQMLDLSWGPITDDGLAHLAELTRLKVLNLCGTRITGAGLRHLMRMKDLQELDLSFTNIDNDGLANLSGLKRLRRLDLSDCHQVSEAGLAHLKGLENLEWLSVSNADRRPPSYNRIVLLDSGKVRQMLGHIKGLTIEFVDRTP
jgi:hypothetical protein